jgi:two-component system, cell cycle response regulator CpdR
VPHYALLTAQRFSAELSPSKLQQYCGARKSFNPAHRHYVCFSSHLAAMRLLKILYVEDNRQVRETICELIENSDREIHACATGEEAWSAFNAHEFHIVVSDISLPGLSGTELTKRIVAAKPEQWIILCSGYALPKDLTKLGANVRSLLKPFDVEDLEALIGEVALTH